MELEVNLVCTFQLRIRRTRAEGCVGLLYIVLKSRVCTQVAIIVGNRTGRSGVLGLLRIMANNWDRCSEYEWVTGYATHDWDDITS